MNDDLHDIDKLFRDGINEHREPLPPAVWEGVSHSLDQQQAAHFKRKYYKLRRWLLLLLLLGGAAGSFFLIDTLKHKTGADKTAAIEARATGKDGSKTETEKGSTNLPAPDVTSSNDGHKKDEGALSEKAVVEKQPVNDSVLGKSTNETGERPNEITRTPSLSPLPLRTAKNETSAVQKKETYGERKSRALVSAKRDKVKQGLTVRSQFAGSDKIKQGSADGGRLAASDKVKQSSTDNDRVNAYEQNQRFYADLIQARNYSTLIELKNRMAPERKNIVAANDDKNGKKQKASAHDFSMTAFAAPNFSFDRLEDDDRLSGPGRNGRDFHQQEDESAAFSAGLLFTYGLTKKVSLESGLAYTHSSTGIGSKTVYAKADGNGHTRYELPCSSGYSYISPKGTTQPAVGDSAVVAGGRYTLNYLSVPLTFSLTLGKGKFTLRPGIGIAGNFLLSGKTQTSLTNATGTESSTNNISGLKSVYLDGRIGLGAEYRLNDKLSISVRPTARIAVTSINQQTPVRSYQNFLSVETGLRIKL